MVWDGAGEGGQRGRQCCLPPLRASCSNKGGKQAGKKTLLYTISPPFFKKKNLVGWGVTDATQDVGAIGLRAPSPTLDFSFLGAENAHYLVHHPAHSDQDRRHHRDGLLCAVRHGVSRAVGEAPRQLRGQGHRHQVARVRPVHANSAQHGVSTHREGQQVQVNEKTVSATTVHSIIRTPGATVVE